MQASLGCPRTARVALLASLAVLAFLTAVVRPSSARHCKLKESTSSPSLQDEVCRTEGCSRTAASLARSMNLSVDPCDDFYQFTCGRFIKDTPLPPDELVVGGLQQMYRSVQQQVRELLEEPHRQDEPAAFGKAKIVYQSCMNTTRREELGVEPVRQVLASLGIASWPILEGDAWDEGQFDWQNMTLKMMDVVMGFDGPPLFDYYIGIDLANTSRTTVSLDAPNFFPDLVGLDNATQETSLSEHRERLMGTALLLRGDATNASLSEEIQRIVSLHREMNMCTMSLEDRDNLTLQQTKMTLSQLQQVYPYVSWLNYTKHVLPAGANVTDDERVLVEDKEYMAALGTILQVTPKRVLANHMVGHVLMGLLEALNERAYALRFKRIGKRWQQCVEFVQRDDFEGVSSLRWATSAMYARRHSSEHARNKTVEMVQGISKEIHRLLDSADWMDPKTRRAALMKVDAMYHNVAYPLELLNDTLLDQFYEKLEVRPNNLLYNHLAISKWSRDRNAETYRTDIKRHHWTSSFGTVDMANAFVSLSDNSLSIPAGVMQAPFFQRDRPQYMNYGGIGFIIGHEASHAFDQTGGLFDLNGQMANWWDSETKKLFDEKVRCMVDQYGSMRNPDVNVTVNGILTLDENIADNVGLKLAYRAYSRYTARHGAEQSAAITVLEDDMSTSLLVLKPRQMFWVSMASSWCEKIRPDILNRWLQNRAHLPSVHRINGALRNVEEFAADFRCPAGSPMNPVHKCQVW